MVIVDRQVEVWKMLPGFEGVYEVSNQGRVRSVVREVQFGITKRRVTSKILATHANKKYVCVRLDNLEKGMKVKEYAVHRLVALAFIGPCPEGHWCCHYDDDKSNNALSNLRYATPKENYADAVRNGSRGEEYRRRQGASSRVLTFEQAHEIRKRYIRGSRSIHGNCIELAREFGVSESLINAIAQGKSYSKEEEAKHAPS